MEPEVTETCPKCFRQVTPRAIGKYGEEEYCCYCALEANSNWHRDWEETLEEWSGI